MKTIDININDWINPSLAKRDLGRFYDKYYSVKSPLSPLCQSGE
jgi:hypothetical protein